MDNVEIVEVETVGGTNGERMEEMSAYDELLKELEAKRDISNMEANDLRMKANTLDYVVIMLRNAISRDKAEAPHA